MLLHILGLDDASGRWYLWWSGVAGDLGYLAIFGALIGILRKHNCHIHHCWRIGHLPIPDTTTPTRQPTRRTDELAQATRTTHLATTGSCR